MLNLTTNLRGWTVRAAGAVPEVIEPAERFAAMTIPVECETMPTLCRVWIGCPRFYVDEQLTTTPRRAALYLAGIEAPDTVKLKTYCKTPNCVSLGHLKW